MSNQHTGTVAWFNPDKGYGFIRPQTGDDLLVCTGDIQGHVTSLCAGQRVSFSVTRDRKAPHACNVVVI